MNEEIKTTILVLISPVLFSILGYILKRFLSKYEESQKKIINSISDLKSSILKVNSEISIVSLNVNRLETNALSQEKLIEKEVNTRNRRLDRQGDAIVECQKDIAVLKHQIK